MSVNIADVPAEALPVIEKLGEYAKLMSAKRVITSSFYEVLMMLCNTDEPDLLYIDWYLDEAIAFLKEFTHEAED